MRKHEFNEKFFDNLNEKSAYWLGFLYADGYVRMKDGKSGELKLKLKDTDKSHIEKFLTHIECKKTIKCGIDNKSKFCSVSIYSNYMVKSLFNLGCVNNKTQKIRLPNINESLMPHFIRGYFDGDGSLSKVKNRPNSFTISICSNKKFNNDLISFLGFGTTYENENYSIVKINKFVDVLKFKKYIYSNAETLLERKFIKFKEVR